MNLTLAEKLHLLGYQFWKEKNQLMVEREKSESLLFVFNKTLMVFCKKELAEIPEEIFNQFILSINISINKNQDYSIVTEFASTQDIKKVVSFGNLNDLDIIKDPSILLINFNSLNEFLNDPLLKKDLWQELSH